jgi:hypothetical protein
VWAPRFLAALREGTSIARAARFAGVARRTVYDRRERNVDFALAWDEACEVGALARIRERTPYLDGAPNQLAARVRAVRYALNRCGLSDLAQELWGVERQLDRQAREQHRLWIHEHGLPDRGAA